MSYTSAALALIANGLPNDGLVVLSRGYGPSPVVNLAMLDDPERELMAIASAFDAEVN